MNGYSDGYFNLIISGGCPGGVNMAADLFLLNKYRTEGDFSSRPTLRLYYFSPPALSLGFFQKDKDTGESIILKAKNKHYDIIRRPTGGRAVLHKNEITYCVVSSYKSGIFAGKLLETYKKAGEFLYFFFTAGLGLNPDDGLYRRDGKKINKTNKPVKKSDFNCFLKAHSYEITFGGKKICGNSQRRGETAFLQHGSIYIDYNPLEHIELFEDGNFNAGYFNNITGIKQELTKVGKKFDLSFRNLSEVLAKSFQDAYNLKPLLMSPQEFGDAAGRVRKAQA